MPTQPLCLTVALVIREGQEDAAAALLAPLALASRQEPGCLAYNVFRSLDLPRRVLIYELYRDEAALDAHRAAPHFTQYAPALYALVEERTATLYGPLAVAATSS